MNGSHDSLHVSNIDSLIEPKQTELSFIQSASSQSLQNSYNHDKSLDYNANQNGALSMNKLMPSPHLSHAPVTQLHRPRAARAASNVATAGRAARPLYRAIKDYTPSQFSRSGHKQLELPLLEGDPVVVLGDRDEHGYVEAGVNGKVGLVPFLYLEPMSQSKLRQKPAENFTTMRSNQAPEQITEMHQELKESHLPDFKGIHPNF